MIITININITNTPTIPITIISTKDKGTSRLLSFSI